MILENYPPLQSWRKSAALPTPRRVSLWLGLPSTSNQTLFPDIRRISKATRASAFALATLSIGGSFEKGRKALTVSPQGPTSFDDPDLVIQAVLNGVGI